MNLVLVLEPTELKLQAQQVTLVIQAGDNSADFFFNDLAFEITGTNDNTEILISRNTTTYIDRCQFKGNEYR